MKLLFEYIARIIMVLVFFSLGTFMVIAQELEREYVPFVEEGKVWYCRHAHYNIDEYFPKRLKKVAEFLVISSG